MKTVHALVVAAAVVGLVSSAHAVTIFWGNTGEGLWNVATNWGGWRGTRCR